MLTSSVIRHPDRSPQIVIHKWQLEALKALNPEIENRELMAAAALLTVFEHHTNAPSANKFLGEEVTRYFADSSMKRSVVFGGWLPYTNRYLQDCTLSLAKNYTAPLDILEAVGFISRKVPDDVRLSMKKIDVWVRLNANAINSHIDSHSKKIWSDVKPEPVMPAVMPSREEKDPQGNGELVESLCEFHRHVAGRASTYVYHLDRKKKVLARINSQLKVKGKGTNTVSGKLFTRDEVIARLAQAIIGNVVSPWHNGSSNPSGTTYHDIDLIFRDDTYMERFIGFAEQHGPCFREDAYKEFMGWLAGQPCKFSLDPKVAPRADEGMREFLDLAPAVQVRYKEFARGIASFFTQSVPAGDVMGFVRTNKGLQKYSSGITNPIALIFQIERAVKTFAPNGLDTAQDANMKKFVGAYCRLQQVSWENENK